MNCTHYWLLEDNQRLMSIGVCKKCGATSKFLNNIDASRFNRLPELSKEELEIIKELKAKRRYNHVEMHQ